MKTVAEVKAWLNKQSDSSFVVVPFGDYIKKGTEEILVIESVTHRVPRVLSELNLKEK